MQTEIRLRESQGRKGGVSLKKTELIEAIAERAEVPKSQAQEYFDAFEEVVTGNRRADDLIGLMNCQTDPSCIRELYCCTGGCASVRFR